MNQKKTWWLGNKHFEGKILTRKNSEYHKSSEIGILNVKTPFFNEIS